MTPTWLDGRHLDDWRDIRSEALRLHPSAFLTTLADFQARPDDDVRAQLDRGHVLGLFVQGRLEATAGYLRRTGSTTNHRAEIGAVYIRADHRGQGLGDHLIEHLERRAAAEGVIQLELNVETRNARAIRFYEKHGFERFGLFPGIVRTEAGMSDDYFYVKRLQA